MKPVAAVLLCLVLIAASAGAFVNAQQEGPFRPKPPAPAPVEPDTIRDRVLFDRVRQWVDQRIEERAKEQVPSDQEIEDAVLDAINGVEPKQGPAGTLARIVAKVVWSMIQLTVGAALVALFWTHPWLFGGLFAAAVAVVGAPIAFVVADIRVRASKKESK